LTNGLDEWKPGSFVRQRSERAPRRISWAKLRRYAVMSETVYNRIALLRAERNVSRRQLADALGVHYQTIGYLERGEYSPSLYLALRIAEYFEVPVEVVFSTTPFPRIGERSA
jgi:putative transcriptional regulator